MPTTATLSPLNQFINSVLTGDKKIDLFALGLAYNTLATPSEATPAHPGATLKDPPIHPAYPAGVGIKGFFEAFGYSRNGNMTDWKLQLPYSGKVLSMDRSFRVALVPLVPVATLPIAKKAANPVPLATPVDNLEQALYDLAIANGAMFTPRIDPATGRDWLEATGQLPVSIEQLLAGTPINNGTVEQN